MAAGIGSMTFDDDLAADGLGSGQIDDIFGDDDDLFNVPAPLPPLSPSNIDAGANEGEGDDSTSNDDKKTKKKVIKRSPQPKLDDIRLCSERGIPALAHLCDGIKFKGKGHEASDLNVLLQRFEHWAHRLYPKFPFQDCVDQIEAMGGKKLVQNTIKAVRRGETGEVNDNNSDEEADVNRDDGNDDAQSVMNDQNFGEQIQIQTSNTPVPQLGLTPEQQERIRLNRERALAKRKEQQSKLASQAETQSQTDENLPVSSPKPDEASQETPLPGTQSPERNKLSFDIEPEETSEILDKSIETKATEDETMENDDFNTIIEPDKTSETPDKSVKTKATEDETMENDDFNKNLKESDDDKIMETEVTQQEPQKTACMNNNEDKTNEDDVAENITESTDTKSSENKTDTDVSMVTEYINKNTDLKGNIDDITMET